MLTTLHLQSVTLPVAWERVVELSVGARPAEPPRLRLMLEVMGRHSNLVLTDGSSGAILAAGYQVRIPVLVSSLWWSLGVAHLRNNRILPLEPSHAAYATFVTQN